MSDRYHLRSPSPPALTSEERDEPEPELDPSTYSPTLPTSRPRNSEELNLLRCQIKLLERMVFRNQNTSTHKLSEIYLPNYDPDEHKITIEEWCKQVTSLITMRGCSQFVAMMKGLACLQGRAKQWADTNAHSLANWDSLQRELIAQFSGETRYIVYVNAFREYTSNQAKCFSEYVAESWRLFSRISPNAPTELMVEAVISGIRPKFYQAELLRSAPKTQAELIATLANYRKRPADAISDEPLAKQPRLDLATTTTCYNCHKHGHISRDCRNKLNCEICKKPGHSSDRCWHKKKNESQSEKTSAPATASTAAPQPSRREVNTIEKEKAPNEVQLQIGDIFLSCLIDSGAECSLIKKKVSGSIKGKRQIELLQLRGFGGSSIPSSESINTVATFNDVTFEVKLHVVNDLNYDVILGLDSIKIPGIKISITNEGTSIERVRYIFINEVSSLANIDTDLKDTSQLISILEKHTDLFTFNKTKKVTTGKLTIRLKDPNRIVQRRPYRLAPIEREKVKTIIEDLKTKGIIRDSCSPFASPILLVKKKNGDDRLCVDFRELNSNTVRDHYPLPLIQDHIDKLGKARFFSSLDMESGFHQIRISEESIEKTAFVTPDGQYEYLSMPFGLSNAPSVYQRAINAALGDYRDNIALVYIDDVLIPSSTEQEGLERLALVLKRLSDAGFTVNPSKCKFLKTSIEYLGNIIKNGEVKPNPTKLTALKLSEPPKTLKQLRQFNGLASYFRRFIPQFSQLMAPLYRLTKRDVPFVWSPDHETRRQHVVKLLTSEPILCIFDPTLPIEVHTDASSKGLGAILIQNDNNRRKVVEYFSMRTSEAETRYHSYELETLAVVRAIKHFRHFLYGCKFTVVTDCNALKASKHKKELTPRVHRLWAYLQNFDFDIVYRKGEQMAHVDFLSRNPQINILTKDPAWIIVEQERDKELKSIRDAIRNKDDYDRKFCIRSNLLMITIQNQKGESLTRTVVPESLVCSLVNRYHENLLHTGWERTLDKIREQFWFKHMTKRVRHFCDNCLQCKIGKEPSGKKTNRNAPY